MGNVINFPQPEDKPYPEMTELERAQAQVTILVAYLDNNDPDWRRKIAEAVDSEN
jgi:hypothetical protein